MRKLFKTGAVSSCILWWGNQRSYVKGEMLVNAGIAERKTAAAYLKELEGIGILCADI
jgi:hypothetical protein